MISELSPGDKLSLKGKIFELRKRLNEVDNEQQRAEEYSFRPQLSNYDHQERGGDFYQSIERAELMRKQKLQLLKATLIEEDSGKCTFRPVITSYKSSSSQKSLPVHLRLQEKGKQYNERQVQRVANGRLYDADGRRLFQPQIPKHTTAGELGKGPGNNVSADEYLYRDARNREIRMQQRVVEAQHELLSEVNARKINPKSAQLLKKRAEREIRSIFEYLDSGNQGELSFQDVRGAMELLHERGQLTRAAMLQQTDKVWALLDTGGRVEFPTFMTLCLAAKSLIPLPKVHGGRGHPSSEDINTLKTFLRQMVVAIDLNGQQSTDRIDQDESFHPEISDRSRVLAEHKAGKESGGDGSSSFDKLLARGKEVERRREQLRDNLLRQEMSECTFHPRRVTGNYVPESATQPQSEALKPYGQANHVRSDSEISDDSDSDVDGSVPVDDFSSPRETTFDRLYKLKDKPVPEKHPHSSITELQACTFKPVVDRSTLNLPVSSHTVGEIKSIEKTVSRMQKARQMRKLEQDRLENMGQVDEEKYAKSRDLLAAGPVPFNFRLEERRRMKDQRQEQVKKARLYVDVKLGANRTVNIAIADGDDPAAVAQQFCKIYALDSSACNILTQVVYDNMIANGIAMQPQEIHSESYPEHQVVDETNNAGMQASASNADSWRPVDGLVDTLQLRKPMRRKTLGRRSDDQLSENDDSSRNQFAADDEGNQDHEVRNDDRFDDQEDWQHETNVQDDEIES